jgi:hypothetical protein
MFNNALLRASLSRRRRGLTFGNASMNMQKFSLLVVFVVVFLAHLQSKNITSGDSRWFIPTAISIIHHHDINLDEYIARIESDNYYHIKFINGHAYNMFPIGTAILSLPVVWMIDTLLDRTAGISFEDHVKENRSEQTERFIASIFVALAAVFMFLIAHISAGTNHGPYLIAFVFAFGTSAWSTASRALWQHGPSMMLLSAGLYCLLKARDRALPLLWLGPILAFAYIVRPTNSISFALLMGVAFLKYRRSRTYWYSVLLSLAVLSCFAALNLYVYDALIPPYYRSSRLIFGSTFAEALAGNLISPNRGLFIFTPVFLLSFYGIFLKVKRRTFKSHDAAFMLILVLHWIVISAFPHWWGGYSIGPRFFTDMVPYFIYFLIPVVEDMGRLTERRRIVITIVFMCMLAISIYAHYRGANSWRVPAWNVTPESVDKNPSRVWDWGDIQFLRRRANALQQDENQ